MYERVNTGVRVVHSVHLLSQTDYSQWSYCYIKENSVFSVSDWLEEYIQYFCYRGLIVIYSIGKSAKIIYVSMPLYIEGYSIVLKS